jgi:hypothetical protein
MGQNWSSDVVIQERHELIERGPYAYVRHPLYSGLLLMLMGVALYYGRKAWIIVFVCCFFGFYFKSQILPIAGSIEVIHTPGHCAGHVALLWRPGRMLFAGDVCKKPADRGSQAPDSGNHFTM